LFNRVVGQNRKLLLLEAEFEHAKKERGLISRHEPQLGGAEGSSLTDEGRNNWSHSTRVRNHRGDWQKAFASYVVTFMCSHQQGKHKKPETAQKIKGGRGDKGVPD